MKGFIDSLGILPSSSTRYLLLSNRTGLEQMFRLLFRNDPSTRSDLIKELKNTLLICLSPCKCFAIFHSIPTPTYAMARPIDRLNTRPCSWV